MTPTADERRVHPLDNPTAVASRLRWLALQISTESQLLDRANPERRRLVGIAHQLAYQARANRHHYDLSRQWIDEGVEVLAEAILNRFDKETS